MAALIGRILISLVAVIWGVGALGADFNATHVFNPAWLPHARFHSALGICLGVGLGLLALWVLWTRSGEPRFNLKVGTVLAGLYCVSFFPAILVPGVSMEDPGTPVPHVAGLAIQLAIAVVSVPLLVLGYVLAARASAAPPTT